MSRAERPPVQTTGWTRPALPLHYTLFLSHFGVFLLPVLLVVGTGALSYEEARQRQAELARESRVVAAWVSADTSPVESRLAAELGPGIGVRLLAPGGAVLVDEAFPEGVIAPSATAETVSAVVTDTAGTSWIVASSPVRSPAVTEVWLAKRNRRDAEVLLALVRAAGWRAVLVASGVIGAAAFAGWRVSRSLRALARVTREVTERGERGEHARWLLDATVGTRIAEVRQVARAFRDTLRRLEERLAYNQEFASNVSHEFRTPLTTLRGTVDLLRDDDTMPAEQRALFLDNARTDLDRLLRMLEGLLDLARVDAAGGGALLRVDEVITAVLRRTSSIRREGSAGSVTGDAALLELALQNLVDNARLHGGPNVLVRAWSAPRATGVDVEDDGVGISPANLAKVFDRFFTTGHDRQGTGLGLALVRAIAHAHGGEVTVESRPGKTVFRLSLPSVN